ncbi:MAG: VWA domain-containing protein [Acidobacteria bacterium]|nr:VWA domain-containing protein [Acidobacteriota bacterium]
MNTTHYHTKRLFPFFLTFLLISCGLVLAQRPVQAQCGPLDVAFVIDDTASLGGSLSNIKAELNNILNDIEKASGNDYRLALVTFKDNVTVSEAFATNNRATIAPKIQALFAEGGEKVPEASDEALNTVINMLAASGRAQVGDFTPGFRERAYKMIILITDAVPGGFDDIYTVGIDDVRAHSFAVMAKEKNIKLSAIYVPTYAEDTAKVKPIMQDYATTTAGFYLETAQNGTGTATAIRTIISGCGSTSTTPTVGFGIPSEIKPGSVLFFNLYTSDPAKPNAENTQINLTNTDEQRPVIVRIFWVDSATGIPTDTFACIPATKHINMRASEIDPGITGYAVAIAVNLNGVPIKFNSLIGSSYVKMKTGHSAVLNAVSFAALADQPVEYTEGDETVTMKFDGAKYDLAPRVMNIDNFPSPLDGNSTLLIVNRFGGDLTKQNPVGSFGNLPSVFYNDAEKAVNVNLPGNACQTRNELKDGYPRVIPRFTLQITQGHTGWMRFSSGDGTAIMGATITYNPNSVRNGGKNLRQVALMDLEQYIIPVTVPVFTCS